MTLVDIFKSLSIDLAFLKKKNLQPGDESMIPTACTFRLASAFSTGAAVHQGGGGHISAAQRLQSVFDRLALSRGRYFVSSAPDLKGD